LQFALYLHSGHPPQVFIHLHFWRTVGFELFHGAGWRLHHRIHPLVGEVGDIVGARDGAELGFLVAIGVCDGTELGFLVAIGACDGAELGFLVDIGACDGVELGRLVAVGLEVGGSTHCGHPPQLIDQLHFCIAFLFVSSVHGAECLLHQL